MDIEVKEVLMKILTELENMRRYAETCNRLCDELNKYSFNINHVQQKIASQHEDSRKSFDSMLVLAKAFREEHEAYGEVKYLGRRIDEFGRILSDLKERISKKEETNSHVKFLNYMQEVMVSYPESPVTELRSDEFTERMTVRKAVEGLDKLSAREREMIVFRCSADKPPSMAKLSLHMKGNYNDIRQEYMKAINKLDKEDLIKASVFSLSKDYHRYTGFWHYGADVEELK